MVTGAEVVVPKLLSVARAVMVWLPVVKDVQAKLNGAVVSVPMSVLPLKNSTLVTTPSGSLAVVENSRTEGKM